MNKKHNIFDRVVQFIKDHKVPEKSVKVAAALSLVMSGAALSACKDKISAEEETPNSSINIKVDNDESIQENLVQQNTTVFEDTRKRANAVLTDILDGKDVTSDQLLIIDMFVNLYNDNRQSLDADLAAAGIDPNSEEAKKYKELLDLNQINANSPLAQYNTATFGIEKDKDGKEYIQWYGDPGYLDAHPDFYHAFTGDASSHTQLGWNFREKMPMAVYTNPTNGRVETVDMPNVPGLEFSDFSRIGTFTPMAEGSAEAPKLETPGIVIDLGKIDLEQNAGSPDVKVYKFDGYVDLATFVSNIKLPYIYEGEEISYAPAKYKYFHTDSLKYPDITISTTNGNTTDSMWGNEYPAGTPVEDVLKGKNGAIDPLSDVEYKVGDNIWFGGYVIKSTINADGTSTFVVYKYLKQNQFHLEGTVPNVNNEKVLKTLSETGTSISPRNLM